MGSESTKTHGLRGYKSGCRCQVCSQRYEAHKQYVSQQQQKARLGYGRMKTAALKALAVLRNAPDTPQVQAAKAVLRQAIADTKPD